MAFNTTDNELKQADEKGEMLQQADLGKLTELHDFFVDLVDIKDGEQLDIDTTLMVLDTMFPDLQELSVLLKTYHENRVVFMDIVLAYQSNHHPEMAHLLFHLIVKCPDILDMRLDDEEGSDSLLFTVCSEKKNYQTLYDLLKERFPAQIEKGENMVAARKVACETLLTQLTQCLQSAELDKFTNMVEQTDPLLLIDTIDIPMLELLLISENKAYFHVILRSLPALIERYLTRNGRAVSLFDLLVRDPVTYRDALRILKETHYQFLSDQRHQRLNSALTVKRDAPLLDEAHVLRPVKEAVSPRTPFLTPEQIEQFSRQLAEPPNGHELFADPLTLLLDIDTDRLIEVEVLDFLLFKLFREPLLEKGIALMPTRPVNTNDRLSPERIDAIVNGASTLYITGIKLDESTPNEVTLVPLCEELKITSSIPLQWIMWPIHLPDESHYGLYIYNIQQKKGHYIEPRRCVVLMQAMQMESPEDFKEYLYTSRIQQMAEDFDIKKGDTKCTFLCQEIQEVSCSDYVIAAIATIAGNKIDLQDPNWDKNFANKFLDKNLVRWIRLLQVQLLGELYFNYQKRQSINPEAQLDFSPSRTTFLSPELRAIAVKTPANQPANEFNGARVFYGDNADDHDVVFVRPQSLEAMPVNNDMLPRSAVKRLKSDHEPFFFPINKAAGGAQEPEEIVFPKSSRENSPI